MKNNLFEYLKSINEECAVIEKQSDGNYHILFKKHMINNDGSYAGWLYTDVPNVKLNDNDKYIIEALKEDETENRAERRKSKRKTR